MNQDRATDPEQHETKHRLAFVESQERYGELWRGLMKRASATPQQPSLDLETILHWAAI